MSEERRLEVLEGEGVGVAPPDDPTWFDTRDALLRFLDSLRSEVEAGAAQAAFFVVLRADGSWTARTSWKARTRPAALVGAIELELHQLRSDLLEGRYR